MSPLKPHQLPSIDSLKQRLDYDPDTGDLRWKVNRQSALTGSIAGTIIKNGYRLLNIDSQRIYAHRLAWGISTGEWPLDMIDHINGVRSDNRLINLRQATRSENMQNTRRAHRGNKSGLLGVTWSASCSKWLAQIKVNGKHQYLGVFTAPEDAHAAYLAAKIRLHPFQTIAKGIA